VLVLVPEQVLERVLVSVLVLERVLVRVLVPELEQVQEQEPEQVWAHNLLRRYLKSVTIPRGKQERTSYSFYSST